MFEHKCFVLAWFLKISKHNVWAQSINLVTTASDEDPKLVRIGFCTAKSGIPQYYRFAYFLPHAHIFKLTEYHSGLIWIQTVFANGERERERDWCRPIKVNIPSADRQVEREREREMCVCVCVCVCVRFEFCQFFYSGNSSTYFKVCVDLCKNIWSYEMSSGFNSWVQY